MIKNYIYRLYPSKLIESKMSTHLDLCRRLYNSLLYLNKITYSLEESFLFYRDLQPIVKTERGIFSQVKQNIARRIDSALHKYFVGKKCGVGFPRFKAKNHYKSWSYAQHGFKFNDGYLTLSKIGRIKVKEHRKVGGKIKTCTIKKTSNKWFVVFSVEVLDNKIQRLDHKEVGLDLGCKDFITLSDGTKVANPKYLKQSMQKISILQSIRDTTISIKKKNKLSIKISKLHNKVHNQREDFLHKLSRRLTKEYSHIYIEDLKVNQLIKNTKEKKNLRKTILDSGWGSFIQKLTYKAEEAGSKLIKVNPYNTTKLCNQCGKIVEKSLSNREHNCSCGFVLDRDHNAALNVLRFGRESLRLDSSLQMEPAPLVKFNTTLTNIKH
jgi:putative transposase